METVQYPEHASLKAINDLSQNIGKFIEWLGEEGIHVCQFDPEGNFDHYTPIRESITQLLARFFEIDLDKLESEKRQMLDEQRALNERIEASSDG